MGYKAICFDVDGTLYPASLMNKKMTFYSLFHPLEGKRYKETRKVFRQYQESFDKIGLENASFSEREASMFIKATKAKISVRQAKEKLENEFYRHLAKVYSKLDRQENVVKTFAFIKKQGLKIGVFSDWPFYSKLELIGVGQYVDFGATSENCGYLKPSKKCFEYILEKMDLKPDEVLYVGDSYVKDVLGATDAGIDAVLIGKKDDPKYSKARKVFEKWEDFDSWLRSLAEDRL